MLFSHGTFSLFIVFHEMNVRLPIKTSEKFLKKGIRLSVYRKGYSYSLYGDFSNKFNQKNKNSDSSNSTVRICSSNYGLQLCETKMCPNYIIYHIMLSISFLLCFQSLLFCEENLSSLIFIIFKPHK